MGLNKDLAVFDTADLAGSDSVGAFLRSSDGTLLTHTTVASDEALDVNLVQSVALVVSATDLDIRDLINTQDSIAIGDETDIVDMQTMDSAFGLTSVGFPIFGVRQDASGSPVSATGDAHPMVFNDDGELKVAADLTSDIADDAADSGNPIKIGGVSFDQSGALSALSASGDRGDLRMDLYRRIMINRSASIGLSATAVTVDDTAGGIALPVTNLAGRTSVILQNRSNSEEVFIGLTGVTTATGLEMPKRSSLELQAGETIDLFGIVGANSADVRVFEMG